MLFPLLALRSALIIRVSFAALDIHARRRLHTYSMLYINITAAGADNRPVDIPLEAVKSRQRGRAAKL